ncbi:hypothetical protein V8C37DRAFT_371737 [Trichoderma ceciliae]
MAWLDGGSASLCSWTLELLLATVVKQINKSPLQSRQREGHKRKERKKKRDGSSPRNLGTRPSPLIVRAE